MVTSYKTAKIVLSDQDIALNLSTVPSCRAPTHVLSSEKFSTAVQVERYPDAFENPGDVGLNELVKSYEVEIKEALAPAYAEVLAATACNDVNACWAWTADSECDASGPSADVSNSTESRVTVDFVVLA